MNICKTINIPVNTGGLLFLDWRSITVAGLQTLSSNHVLLWRFLGSIAASILQIYSGLFLPIRILVQNLSEKSYWHLPPPTKCCKAILSLSLCIYTCFSRDNLRYPSTDLRLQVSTDHSNVFAPSVVSAISRAPLKELVPQQLQNVVNLKTSDFFQHSMH